MSRLCQRQRQPKPKPLSAHCVAPAVLPSPGHFPLSTTPHLPTPLTTHPFLLPFCAPPNPKARKIFQNPLSLLISSSSFPFSITTSNTCVSAQRPVVCLISTSFLGHEATLIKLLLIAPESYLFNSQSPFSNAPPPQVQVRTSYSTSTLNSSTSRQHVYRQHQQHQRGRCR